MLSATSIIAIAVTAVVTIGLLVVTTVRTEPGDRLNWLSESALYVLAITALLCFMVGGIEAHEANQQARDREAAQVEAIEDRYDIEVSRAVFGEPGDWRIDDAWLRCFIPDEDASPADVTLSCDPTSNSAEAFVDFSDLNTKGLP